VKLPERECLNHAGFSPANVKHGPDGAACGLSLLETVVALGVMAILLTLVYTRWQGYMDQQRLRYGAAQVASDLRLARERARAERIPYAVTFTGSSPDYTIARSGGGFLERTRLPDGVSAVADLVVTFDAFGQPDSAREVTIQNPNGTRTASVSASGGITYQEP
jgi:Tfp pilus assembly protein FimT